MAPTLKSGAGCGDSAARLAAERPPAGWLAAGWRAVGRFGAGWLAAFGLALARRPANSGQSLADVTLSTTAPARASSLYDVPSTSTGACPARFARPSHSAPTSRPCRAQVDSPAHHLAKSLKACSVATARVTASRSVGVEWSTTPSSTMALIRFGNISAYVRPNSVPS